VPDLSRSAAQRLIDEGRVTVNGEPARSSYKLRAGDQVVVLLPGDEPHEILPEAIPLQVVYEDSVLLVVDKPAGMVVHPAPGHEGGTLANALLAHSPELGGQDPGAGLPAGDRPSPGPRHVGPDPPGQDREGAADPAAAIQGPAGRQGLPGPGPRSLAACLGAHRSTHRPRPAAPAAHDRAARRPRSRDGIPRPGARFPGRRGPAPVCIAWCRPNRRQDGPTRSACTWLPWVTQWWAMRSTAVAGRTYL
jgi:hypothetical protein